MESNEYYEKARAAQAEVLRSLISGVDLIYIDSCSLMDPYMPEFAENVLPILEETKKQIIVIENVRNELKAHLMRINIDMSSFARKINAYKGFYTLAKVIEIAKARGFVPFAFQPVTDEVKIAHADAAFETIVSAKSIKSRIMVITQDTKLSGALRNLNQSEATTRKPIMVCKITHLSTTPGFLEEVGRPKPSVAVRKKEVHTSDETQGKGGKGGKAASDDSKKSTDKTGKKTNPADNGQGKKTVDDSKKKQHQTRDANQGAQKPAQATRPEKTQATGAGENANKPKPAAVVTPIIPNSTIQPVHISKPAEAQKAAEEPAKAHTPVIPASPITPIPTAPKPKTQDDIAPIQPVHISKPAEAQKAAEEPAKAHTPVIPVSPVTPIPTAPKPDTQEDITPIQPVHISVPAETQETTEEPVKPAGEQTPVSATENTAQMNTPNEPIAECQLKSAEAALFIKDGALHVPPKYTEIGRLQLPQMTAAYIPNTVRTLKAQAFADCVSLLRVALPDSLELIEEGAFSGCVSLQSVTIPASVSKIDSSAFKDCTSMTYVTISSGVEVLGTSVFANCESLSEARIPATVKSISPMLFRGCKSLQNVHLCDGVEYICASAFANCTSLVSVMIPRSVKQIAGTAFLNCPNLVIYCYKDSFAHSFAIEHNIRYQVMA